jgi:hypothetical protein
MSKVYKTIRLVRRGNSILRSLQLVPVTLMVLFEVLFQLRVCIPTRNVFDHDVCARLLSVQDLVKTDVAAFLLADVAHARRHALLGVVLIHPLWVAVPMGHFVAADTITIDGAMHFRPLFLHILLDLNPASVGDATNCNTWSFSAHFTMLHQVRVEDSWIVVWMVTERAIERFAVDKPALTWSH